ncbi:E1 [Martes foina papillomavirus 1]|uniref:Replication protein E1 n=1 Tax=Martes foina papillomavirus 1 TaxID=2831903 RepID=A0AAE7UVC7_9PAPI|nr:E1 [Martes foina papillomavirus 1]
MEGELEAGTGPDEGGSGWYIVREAECSETDEGSSGEEGADLADLVDNARVVQGNSRELFHKQVTEEDDLHVQALKRKYIQHSPAGPTDKAKVADLSPRLNAINITPPKATAKRRLFESSLDSGIGNTEQNETLCPDGEALHTPQVQGGERHTDSEGGGDGEGEAGEEYGSAAASAMLTQLLKCSNRRATMLAKFKAAFGMGFGELTRTFKSDKTCNEDWVAVVYGVRPAVYEGTKDLLSKHCSYINMTSNTTATGLVVLMLLRFFAQKARDTLVKLLRTLLNVTEYQIMANPPKIRSTPAALYWYKQSMSRCSITHGEVPEWITRQTLISHQTADETKFELSQMVQWALDNEYIDECTIAYEYAKLADEDLNAAAWLGTNAQAKYVRDCTTMVRHYRRALMRSMSMSAWIRARMDRIAEGGDWKHIVNFLKYQHIEFIAFLGALTRFLKGTPKQNCIAICGPPNTGKSMFTMSLLSFMGGCVISYANARSQFWLQPLADARLALLDDATKPCWDYMDVHLRNALDGNPICLDLKHRAPMQIKCPPLLVTSNIDIREDDRWRYLHSRVQCFVFKNEFPFNDLGQPIYVLNDANWKCFFERLWLQLDLSDQEDEGDDGEPQQTFRCGTRRTSDVV